MDTREAEVAATPMLPMRDPASPYYINRIRLYLFFFTLLFLLLTVAVGEPNWSSMRAYAVVDATVVSVSPSFFPSDDSSLQRFTYTFDANVHGRTCTRYWDNLDPVGQPTWQVGDTVSVVTSCSTSDGTAAPVGTQSADFYIYKTVFHYGRVLVPAVPAGVLLLLLLASPWLVGPADRYLGRISRPGRPVRTAGRVGHVAVNLGLYGLCVGPTMSYPHYYQFGTINNYVVWPLVIFAGGGTLGLIGSVVTHWWAGPMRIAIDDQGISLSKRDWQARVELADIVSVGYRRKNLERALVLETRPTEAGDPPPVDVINLVDFTFPQRVRIFAALYGRVTWTWPPDQRRWFRGPKRARDVPVVYKVGGTQAATPIPASPPGDPRLLGGTDPVADHAGVV